MAIEAADPDAITVSQWAGRSQRLRQRRFELLPLRGPGAAFTQPQGRSPSSSSTAPAHLAEIITSIAEHGLLQPVLVEENHTAAGTQRKIVVGERRYRAMLWGAANLPDNPHFAELPAVVCPGPLGEEDARIWQLLENLAREDLKPGELAAALVFERCAVLAARLVAAGVAVPDTVWAIDDPIQRWDSLEKLRHAAAPDVGAPWPQVLRRLGMTMREETARRLARALRQLPAELSADMDAHDVALATRLDYIRLNRGRHDAASAIWEALKDRSQPQLLAAAVRAATDTDVDPDAAVEHAQAAHLAANEARRHANRPPGSGDNAEDLDVSTLLAAQRGVLAALRAGRRPSHYDSGSLRLGAHELLDLLTSPSTPVAAHDDRQSQSEAAA